MISMVSCEDFLQRNPENEVSATEFMRTENDLKLYANGLLQRHLPDQETIAWGGDQYSDYVATRSSTAFLIGDNWTADEQGGWGGGSGGKWSQLREINYFLDNLPKAKENVSDEVYRHYEGVGRFWRAYFYYDMVRTFGDVPWYDHELDVDEQEQLYKPRDSREFVMDKVLEDLNFAIENCSDDARYVRSATLIHKWVALAFKSRVCLFEGTYRKYHDELGLGGSASRFLEQAANAAETLMSTGPYSLASGGDPGTQYRSLFTSETLNKTEVILGLAFKTDVRMHAITWKLFSASFGNNWSMTQQFANQYLMLDGSRFTDQAGYDTKTYQEAFQNRDYRLQQTVVSPGYTRKISGTVRKDAPNFALTSTGYQLIKWALDDDVHVGVSTANNSIPVFRYAEVLLNYAEAKAELGDFGESEWNQTIKLLRQRAGVNGAAPETYDPYMAAYFLNQTTDKWILEIRRERGVELAFENLRYDDIMRWKMGPLTERVWQGIYIPQKGEVYDLNGDGRMDLSVVDAEPPAGERVPGVVYVVLGSTYRLSDGDGGNLEYGFNQGRKWLDKKYLRPIPTSAITVNPDLGQNPGW